MRGKKLRKQLMGIGVSRNDAAAFIRGYRAIQKSGKSSLCQDIMRRDLPAPVFRDRPLAKLVASAEIPDFMLFDAKAAEGHVKRELAAKLGEALLDNGVVIQSAEFAPRGSTVFRAMVQVVLPEVEHG